MSEWLVLIGILLAAGIFYALVIALGVTFLSTATYYIVLCGTTVTMIALSYGVVKELLLTLAPGKNLLWLTGAIATIGIFVPIYKAGQRHRLDQDPTGWLEKAKVYAPIAFLVVGISVSILSLASSGQFVSEIAGNPCPKCPISLGNWLVIFIISTVGCAVALGFIFVSLYGGITALLGSVALLIHTSANGGPVNLMLLFDTLIGIFNDSFSAHLPAAAALVWALISAA
ncbi:MAG: hypothetical protein WBN07_01785, partial [Woeseiaceae bacterium]